MAWQLQAFAALVLCYHAGEWLIATKLKQGGGWASLLITKPYCLAMAMGLAEYHLEAWALPQLKRHMMGASFLGLAMVLLGESIRKAGMLTAGANFTHLIQTHKRPEHQLVTWGVYRYVRHPAYLGWMVWAVGTQVLLGNPLSAAAFLYMAWSFFRRRVRYEEELLVQFFGAAYLSYRARTPTYMPLIP